MYRKFRKEKSGQPGSLVARFALDAVIDHADGKDDKGQGKENRHDPVVNNGRDFSAAPEISCNDQEQKANESYQPEKHGKIDKYFFHVISIQMNDPKYNKKK